MEIGDWKATRQLGALYEQIRKLGLEQNIAELDAFGFTILEPGKAAPVEWTQKLRQAFLDVVERRTGVKHDIETGEHGMVDTQPSYKHQYDVFYLLLEDPIFQEAIQNPYLLALQTYMLGFDCQISACGSIMKWQEAGGYGPSMGLHADTNVTHPTISGKDAHSGNGSWVLTDYTKDNGCIAFVPGSHRRTRQPKPGEGVDEVIPLETPAGSLVVWNGNLWHGAYPRINPGLRMVMYCLFYRPYLYPNEDYRHTVTQEILDRNPKRLQVLLGLSHPYMIESAAGPDHRKHARLLKAALEESGMPLPENLDNFSGLVDEEEDDIAARSIERARRPAAGQDASTL